MKQRIMQATQLRELRYSQILSTNLNQVRDFQQLPRVTPTNYANVISLYMDTMQAILNNTLFSQSNTTNLSGAVYLSGGNVKQVPQTNSPNRKQ